MVFNELDYYLRDIKIYKPFSKDEEIEFSKEIEK